MLGANMSTQKTFPVHKPLTCSDKTKKAKVVSSTEITTEFTLLNYQYRNSLKMLTHILK